MKQVWALGVEVPQSVADAAFDALPENPLGQTAFKKENEDRSDDPLWVVQGLYAVQPEEGEFGVALAILAASNNHAAYKTSLEQIPATGWLKKNEESYAPIRVGRIVIHSVRDAHLVQPHEKGIALPIGAAFGTGEHPTTFGCLMALQMPGLLKRGMHAIDIGTGSGVLAFAAARLKNARVLAGEMDGESVFVARENNMRNGLRKNIRIEKAMGFNHRIMRGKKVPLVLSNIFAKPLAKLAPAMRKHLQPGGHVVLAGFLHRDVRLVQNAYASQRIYLKRRLSLGAWSILVLRRPDRGTKMLSKSR